MTDIVAQLAELIVKDNALLLVGSDLGSRENRSTLVQQIAEALAQRIDYAKPDRSLAAVARDFQAMQGRNALVAALREEVARSAAQPAPIHQLIADAVLPTTKVITTRFDRTLERAFDQFRKPYVLIVRDTDVSFFDESKLTLIKIQGDIEQPDSLVITEDDVEDFISNLPTLSDVVRAFFATKTLIFIGYDLESAQFKRLFRQVTRNLSVYRRTAYAIQDRDLAAPDRRYWEEQGVDIRTQDPTRFLEELAAAVKDRVQQPIPPDANPLGNLASRTLPTRPYKGLDSFSAADSAIFFGRDLEVRRFINRVLANRLTILHGESGSGKSSLLRAGLGPALLARQALLAVAQPDARVPLADRLRESLAQVAQAANVDVNPGGDLAQLVRDLQYALDAPIVLGVDQAEQFFLVYSEAEQQTAILALRQLVTDRSLNLRIILVVREDFLGRLQPLEGLLPNVLDARFRLDILGEEAAREAIEEPARLLGIVWEPTLVSRLLQDLYDSERRGISPPQLQINCQRLYTEAVNRSGRDKVTITLALFESLGNTAAILGGFLNQSIVELPDARQTVARTLLGSLVNSSGAKQRLNLADLSRSAQLGEADARQVLDLLVDRSIVRQIVLPAPDQPEGGQNVSYELAHDYLITPIIAWLGDEFWAAQKAREILRQAVAEWTARMRLLPPEDLALATRQAGQLQLSEDETHLLYASAVAHLQDIDFWRAQVDDVTRHKLLAALCRHPESEARSHAATRLAQVDDASAGDLLAELVLTDSELDVREAAAVALAGMVDRAPTAGAGGVGKLAKAVQSGDSGQGAGRAMPALVTMRDLAPAVHPLLPAGLAQPVLRRVWRVRWRRSREWVILRLVRGLQGGFWGMGLGIGLFLGLNRLLADGFTLALLAQRFESILFGISSGIPVMGVIGAASTAVVGAAGALLTGLEDYRRPRRTWAVQTGVGVVALGLLWSLFAFVFPGVNNLLRTLSTGGLIGLGLFGAATVPLPVSSWVRLGIGAVVGAATLLLAYGLGLVFVGVFWWILWMGAISGLGVAWGLPPIKQGRIPGGEE